MYSYSQWRDNKSLQQEYEQVYNSNMFQCLKDVLIDVMFRCVPNVSQEAQILEAEAMRGVFQKGEKHIIDILDVLRPGRIVENKNTNTELVTPSGIPYTQAQADRIKASLPK